MQEQGSIQKAPGIVLWLKIILGIVFVLAVLSVVTVSIKSTQIPDSLLTALPAPRSFRVIATIVQDALVAIISATLFYGLHFKKQWAFWLTTFGWVLLLLLTCYGLIGEILTGSWKDIIISFADLAVLFVLTWTFSFRRSTRRFFCVK